MSGNQLVLNADYESESGRMSEFFFGLFVFGMVLYLGPATQLLYFQLTGFG